MEYISHEDYKKMLTGFGKEVPKAELNEGLEKEGNAFTAGLAKTKKGGEFKIGDKEFTDRTNYDASVSEEYDSPYDGGADDLAAMAKDDVSKDTHGAAYHIGDKVDYQGHSFTIMIGAGGTVVLKHSTGRIIPNGQSMGILKQAAINKKFGSVDEYQFDQMYPDDPGPFEGKRYMDPDEPDFSIAVGEDLESSDLTPEQLKAALEYLEDNSYDLQGDFANSHEVGGGSSKAARYIVGLIKQKNQNMDSAVKEFLAKEDDVNWDRVDDEEAEENETDNGIEEDEMEEGINLPSSQPTGPSIQEKTNRLAHLTSEERDQLKQYVETIRTVKEEIKKMVGKQDMEEGGDNTNLIMKPSTVSEDGGSEYEEVESNLDPKVHEAFHKVVGMAVKELIGAGIEASQIKAFFQHEISELPEFASRQYEE